MQSNITDSMAPPFGGATRGKYSELGVQEGGSIRASQRFSPLGVGLVECVAPEHQALSPPPISR